MRNILLAGVGGQGTVLAAKLLAMASADKGWKVRTAETIGMAQRGGSVTSHVRVGDLGEEVHAPLIAKGTADLIIAFEPGEAARSIEYLAQGGTIISAKSVVEPVSASIESFNYDSDDILETIAKSLEKGKDASCAKSRLIAIDDDEIIDELGGNRKILNTVMLASAIASGCLPFSEEDLEVAIREYVKPKFIDMNLNAIKVAAKKGADNANEA